MDTSYSLLLAASLITGGASLAGALLLRFRDHMEPLSPMIWPLAVLSLLLDAGSLLVHLVFGHTPGTEMAMTPLQFLREHISFAVAVVPGPIAIWLNKLRTRDRADRRHH